MLKYVNHDIVFQEFPDEVTLAINLSCCPIGCPGCHSPYLQKNVGEELTFERLDGILANYAENITCVGMMGGDGDPAAVAQVLEHVKEQYPQLKTGWYSGKSRLPDNLNLFAFSYIKLGPYKELYGPLSVRTTNQKMYKVTRGRLEDITFKFWKER